MKRLRTTAVCILILGVLISFTPLIFYLSHFATGQDYSTSKDDWGTFGDFIGGTINPIIGLINLALLVVISFAIARSDDSRQINEYRYKIYTELYSKFAQLDSKSENIEVYQNYLKQFVQFNQFLFEGKAKDIFNQVINQLIEDIKALLLAVEDDEDHTRTFSKTDSLPISRKDARAFVAAMGSNPPDDPVSNAWRTVSESQMRLVSFIQAVMVGGDLSVFIPPAPLAF